MNAELPAYNRQDLKLCFNPYSSKSSLVRTVIKGSVYCSLGNGSGITRIKIAEQLQGDWYR